MESKTFTLKEFDLAVQKAQEDYHKVGEEKRKDNHEAQMVEAMLMLNNLAFSALIRNILVGEPQSE